MIPDPDGIFTHALLEPATQEFLARLPKAGEPRRECDTDPEHAGRWADRIREPQTLDRDGGHGEIVNAQALLRHLCEVLNVPLVDLVKTVEALPRWVPVESVKDGTVFYASARPPYWHIAVATVNGGVRAPDTMDSEWREYLQGGYVLLNGLAPKPPKVSP